MDTMRDRFAPAVSRMLDEDPRVAVVVAEIGAAALDGARARHPDRVINVGIREQLLIGAGAGLALTGMRPVVHTFASFLVERPFEQVKLDLGHQDVGAVLVSLDVTVLYATTVRPFDAAALRWSAEQATADVVLVEPYLAGTSTAAANDALADLPHRVLGLGVGRRELRRYGTVEEHVAAHGLDAGSLRERIGAFLAGGRVPVAE
ncbi:hypothetical protein ABZ722_15675 [Streptomyces longwoodensis]|uniref:hypothetical protein n=1 Tax=Streptomyces longwoodensis TaxID=68231 RepID=UPI0033FF4353